MAVASARSVLALAHTTSECEQFPSGARRHGGRRRRASWHCQLVRDVRSHGCRRPAMGRAFAACTVVSSYSVYVFLVTFGRLMGLGRPLRDECLDFAVTVTRRHRRTTAGRRGPAAGPVGLAALFVVRAAVPWLRRYGQTDRRADNRPHSRCGFLRQPRSGKVTRGDVHEGLRLAGVTTDRPRRCCDHRTKPAAQRPQRRTRPSR